MNRFDKSATQLISADPRAGLALNVIRTLGEAGFVAYLAGGCVRDALLKKTPKDYDVATNAHPSQIQELFGHRRTIAIGAAFGVISVIPGREFKSTCPEPVEVATFRSDGAYTDGRRPDEVHFSSPELDALRRDFTINGMFFDPQQGQVIDYVGGCEDLQGGLIRAIGDPLARFEEDKLRLLRAIRFATTYAFGIEEATWEAIRQHATDVVVCSGERIGAEMRRLLVSQHASHGIALLRDSRLAEAIMPRVARRLNEDDVLQLVQQRMNAETEHQFAVRLAILALAVDEQESDVIDQLAELWRLSNEEAEGARAALVSYRQLLEADQSPWSRLQPLLVQRYRDQAVALARAVGGAEHQSSRQRIDEALSWPAHQLDPEPLLTGADLIALGLAPGPQFKGLLSEVRDAQLDRQVENREQAIELVRERLASR